MSATKALTMMFACTALFGVLVKSEPIEVTIAIISSGELKHFVVEKSKPVSSLKEQLIAAQVIPNRHGNLNIKLGDTTLADNETFGKNGVEDGARLLFNDVDAEAHAPARIQGFVRGWYARKAVRSAHEAQEARTRADEMAQANKGEALVMPRPRNYDRRPAERAETHAQEKEATAEHDQQRMERANRVH